MDDARYFDEGKLVVFKRNRIYQHRSFLNGTYVWRTLKTCTLEEAITKAQKAHYYLLAQQEQGLPIKAKLFRDVIDEYVASREKSAIQGKTKSGMLRQIKRVVKFWRAFAGSKRIHDIGDAEFRDYVEWRRDYYTAHYVKLGKPLPHNAKLHPTDKTLAWEIMLGKAIIKWAHDKGLRGSKQLPTYTFTPKVKRVRPAFELAEYRILWRALRKRMKRCDNPQWRATRELLCDYVLILANSGMRVGEANNLRMRDIIPFTDEWGRESFRLKVTGKTGEREVIPRANAAQFIQRVIARRAGAKPNERLFVMPSGSPIITLADQPDAVLKEAGITHNSMGEKYTLYSLRHFYAVTSLRGGMSVYALRTNMGTSVQIIEAYYGKHATSPTFATELGH